MRDGRWTFFSIVNNILLAFHLLVFLKMLSASSSLSGMHIPLLVELTVILPPLAGLINNLFNHSIIRKNYHRGVPLSPTKKNWQLLITLLFAAAAIILIIQQISFLKYLSEEDQEENIRLIIIFRVILVLYSVLSIYLILFQLLAARKAGSSPEESDVEEPDEETDTEEESDDEETEDDNSAESLR